MKSITLTITEFLNIKSLLSWFDYLITGTTVVLSALENELLELGF